MPMNNIVGIFMSETKTIKKERPLSPHLQVYKPQITSVTSILHRISGIALTLGLLMLVWGIYALAAGRDSYDAFVAFCGSGLGQVMLMGWSAAFFYHMSTGIRHFILDSGYLFEKCNTAKSGYAVILIAALLTGALWGAIYGGLI